MSKRPRNAWAKTRPIEHPYYTVTQRDWTWRVLKAYQRADKARANPYARVFCAVSSPHTTPGFDLGDVYLSTIPHSSLILDAQHIEETIP